MAPPAHAIRSRRMGILSELRYPTKWYAKLFTAILALAFFILLATATISGFLLYRIVLPARSRPDINLRDFPGHPEEVTFEAPGIGPRAGWFFPGLRNAPTVILCHGYQSNRGELLTLVTALQENQFNVYVFDLAGHGSSAGRTSFGFNETQELRAAMAEIARRDDVDRVRFGLWGTTLGAYTALAVAEADPRVRALVVDAAYDRPLDMLRLQVDRSGLGGLPLIHRATDLGFKWLYPSHRNDPPLSARLSKLAGVPKLFIIASDDPQLAESTRELFLRSPGPREQIIIPRGNYAVLSDEDKHGYENRIVSFFLANLPPAGHLRR